MDLYSPYSLYSKRKRARISRQTGHDFRGCFEHFSCCCWAVQNNPYSKLFARISGAKFMGGSYSNTDLTRKSRQKVWGNFWVL
jgi:hypothetical protein